ncbi:MAG TPA: non-canonical purine NTP pyrophosphatase, RdgB/HAM1 family [Gammaproteobacteria bacterium]|jgi:XTP/dITP diphosphohydrolase|nr:non-canonical purine NTP pyrophosphatase, RdgB/HAM1 family [Gammaproteobacteria bacterium]HAE70036.1 non-canonical purine NTP pyrophosphatase, RdgB/HAM1 family [Gammaproteobacteria bacterium]HAE73378.1 non-canonical purine NTP pyrophosphatase, RdgB/HAM1 family [Gammaproteobacteria bacterium]HAG47582.1 non-canonical purine NTP pyrophosphatase, RdgB/HAM1 family [Gammaproteobacteria bacterium]HAO38215.1 non-canonical purine NTP pyrophosphatase, RdgB/HAM1 family [Gammaproteobacteria bacterium]
MKKIILASNNKGKIREFNAMLDGLYEVVSMSDRKVEEVPETGLTFVENALIKARNASEQSGLPALADDSGIVVDALSGEPGIYSARYAGNHGDDEANTQKLLDEMQGVADGDRSARFWCAIVFVEHANDPTPIIIQRGWEGEILRKKVGENGFGYDPIFYVPTHSCASAELAPEIKNTLSHRGRALIALLKELKAC